MFFACAGEIASYQPGWVMIRDMTQRTMRIMQELNENRENFSFN